MKTLIIVEGTKPGIDKKFIQGILESYKFDLSCFEIKTTEDQKRSSGSKTDVLKYLTNQLYSDTKIDWNNIQNVLIIVDANDKGPKKSFQEIINALEKNDRKNNFNIPVELNTINQKSSEKINVGVFLFPNCEDKGSIETLCLGALKHEKLEQKLDCIKKYFECLKSNEIDNIKKATENKKAKSKFRVFTVTLKLNSNIRSIIDCINFKSDVFSKLVDFIKKANEK